MSPPPEEEFADIQLLPAESPAAGDHGQSEPPSSARPPPYNPMYADPSMTLPPFGEGISQDVTTAMLSPSLPLDPSHNTFESLLSLTPNPRFLSINSFFQAEASPHPPAEVEVGFEALSSEHDITHTLEPEPFAPLEPEPFTSLDPISEDDVLSFQEVSTTDSGSDGLSPVQASGMNMGSQREPMTPLTTSEDLQNPPINTSTPLLGGEGEGGLRHRDTRDQ